MANQTQGDRISRIYMKAVQRGVINGQQVSEDRFRESMKNDSEVDSFYAAASAGGMKLSSPEDFKKLMAHPDLDREAALNYQEEKPTFGDKVRTLGQKLSGMAENAVGKIKEATPLTVSAIAGGVPGVVANVAGKKIAGAVSDKIQERQAEEEAARAENERMQNATLHLSAEDVSMKNRMDGLRSRIEYNKKRGVEEPWYERELAELEQRMPQYLQGEDVTPQGVLMRYANAWSVNTPEGRERAEQMQREYKEVEAEAVRQFKQSPEFAALVKEAQGITDQQKRQEINARIDALFAEKYGDVLMEEKSRIGSAFLRDAMAADNGYVKREQERMTNAYIEKAIQDNMSAINAANQKKINDFNQRFGNGPGLADAKSEYAMSVVNTGYSGAARQLLWEAQTLMGDTKKGEYGFGSFTKDFFRNAGTKLRSLASYGMSDLESSKLQADVLTKIAEYEAYDNPEMVLNADELALFNAIVTKTAAEIMRSDNMAWSASAAKQTADMLPFVRDIVIGNAVFGGLTSAAREGLVRGITRKLGQGWLGNLVADFVATNTVGVASSAASALILPSTLDMAYKNSAKVNPNAIEINGGLRLKDGGIETQGFGASYLQALATQTKEIFTETGGNTQVALRAIGNTPMMRALGQSSVGQLMTRLRNTGAGQLLEQTAYHGILGEASEEFEGTFYDACYEAIKAAANGGSAKEAFGNVYGEFLDPDTLVPMLISFGAVSGLGGIAGGTQLAHQAMTQRRYNQAKDALMGAMQNCGMSEDEQQATLDDLRGALYTGAIDNLPQKIAQIAAAYSADGSAENEALQVAMGAYLVADAKLGAVQMEHQADQDNVRKMYEESMRIDDELEQQTNANDGKVHRTASKGNPEHTGYIVSGDPVEVRENADGTLSYNGNGVVTAAMDDGTVEQTAISNLTPTEMPAAVNEVRKSRLQHAELVISASSMFHPGSHVEAIGPDGMPTGQSSRVVNVSDDGVEIEMLGPDGQPTTTIIPLEAALQTLHPLRFDMAIGEDLTLNIAGELQSFTYNGGGMFTAKDGSGEVTEDELMSLVSNGATIEGEQAPAASTEAPAAGEPAAQPEEQPAQPAAPTAAPAQEQQPSAPEKKSPKQMADELVASMGEEKARKKVQATVAAIDQRIADTQAKLDKAQQELDDMPIAFDEESAKAQEKAQKAVDDLTAIMGALQGQKGQYDGMLGEMSVPETNLSDETDEYGKRFAKSTDGSTIFGHIEPETGLTPAPIKLSEGEDHIGEDGNHHGYGIAHIEAEHGEDIRKHGYKSVEQFVEDVCSNWTDIRMGNRIAQKQTYIVEIEDEHNNIVFIEMSNDGTYWNVNTGGVFRKTYARKRPVIKDRKPNTLPALGSSTSTDATGVNHGQVEGATVTSGNSPLVSEGKDTTNNPNEQISEEKNAEKVQNSAENGKKEAKKPEERTFTPEEMEAFSKALADVREAGDRLASASEEMDARMSLGLDTKEVEKALNKASADHQKAMNAYRKFYPKAVFVGRQVKQENIDRIKAELQEQMEQERAAQKPKEETSQSLQGTQDKSVLEGLDVPTAYEKAVELANEGRMDEAMQLLDEVTDETQDPELASLIKEDGMQEQAIKHVVKEYNKWFPEHKLQYKQAKATKKPAGGESPTTSASRLDEYVKDMPQVKRAKIMSTLGYELHHKDLGVLTRAAYIEKRVGEGREFFVNYDNGKPYYGLYSEDKSKYTPITKIEYDYATFLGGKVTSAEDVALRKEEDRLATLNKKLEFVDDKSLNSRIEAMEKHESKLNPNNYQQKQMLDQLNEMRELRDLRAKANQRKLDAARQQVDTNPTDGQKEAGNYKKGHVNLFGFDITLENPKGSTRSGKDADGTEWSITMNNDYGYIRGTESVDGDHIDIYLGDNTASEKVFVMDAINQKTGAFDEHKVLLGFDSADAALEAYLANYEKGWKPGTLTEVSLDEFRKWIESSHRKTKPFAEYKNVKTEGAQGTPAATSEGTAKVERESSSSETNVGEIPDSLITKKYWNGRGRLGDDIVGKVLRDHPNVMPSNDWSTAIHTGASTSQVYNDVAQELEWYDQISDIAYKTQNSDVQLVLGGLRDRIMEHLPMLDAAEFERLAAAMNVSESKLKRDNLTAMGILHAEYLTRQEEPKYIRDLRDQKNAGHLADMVRSLSERKLREASERYPVDAVKKEIARRDGLDPDARAFDNLKKVQTMAHGTAKKAVYTPSNYVVTDETLRPTLWGVYHKDGIKVTTDAHILFAYRDEYPAENEGKILLDPSLDKSFRAKVKKGHPGQLAAYTEKLPVIEGRYPNWRAVIPKKTADTVVSKVDAKDLRNFLAGAMENLRKDWKALRAADKTASTWEDYKRLSRVAIRFSDGEIGLYVTQQLEHFADALELLGADEVYYASFQGKKKLLAETDKGTILLMPIVSELNEAMEEPWEGAVAQDSPVNAIGDTRQFVYDLVAPQGGNTPDGGGKRARTKKEVALEAQAERKAKTEKAKAAASTPGSFADNADTAKREKIEDVGEKIGGARKDILRELADRINVNGETFAQIFPKFDLPKLIEKGLDPQYAAGLKFVIDHSKGSYKAQKKRLGRGPRAEQKALDLVRFMAAYAKGFLNGDMSTEFEAHGWHFTEYGKLRYPFAIEMFQALYKEMGNDMFAVDLSQEMSDIVMTEDERKRHMEDRGEKYFPSTRTFYRDGKEFTPRYETGLGANTKYFTADEKQQAIDFFVETVKKATDYKNTHKYKLGVYYSNEKTADGKTQYFVGTKIGGKLIELTPRGPEYTLSYMQEHNEELQLAAERKAAEVKEQNKEARKIATVERQQEWNPDAKRWEYFLATKIDKDWVPVSDRFWPEGQRGEDYRAFLGKIEAATDAAQEKAQQLLDEYLQRKEESKGWKPQMNIGQNRPRVGVDWRAGEDVSAVKLRDTFGFRGVEFGNYVNQKERQQFINECYDALMDMAQLLDVSPRALSLNGQLGLAIGARGLGGAKAHYEPAKNVINLTKNSGWGSLAHEWWHAMDFYFGQREKTKSATQDLFSPDTRTEVQKAFGRIMDVMKTSTEYGKRSQALDKFTGKKYYATPTEMGARAFQDYVVRMLTSRSQVNDFLSHYTSAEDWNGKPETYPYPVGKEGEEIAKAMLNLFDTLQEETDVATGNVRLYSRVGDSLTEAEDSQGVLTYDRGLTEAEQLATDGVMAALEEAGVTVHRISNEEADAMGDEENRQYMAEAINARFNAELQSQIDGTLEKGHVYKFGRPSSILIKAGLPDLDIELVASRLSDKSMQENHPFSLEEIKGLPNAIQNPLAVMVSATRLGSHVILTELKHGNDNFVVAVSVNKTKDKVEVNSIRSVHYRNKMNIINLIAEGLGTYYSPKMADWIEKTKIELRSKPQYNSADVRAKLNSAAKVVKNFDLSKFLDEKMQNSGENEQISFQKVGKRSENERLESEPTIKLYRSMQTFPGRPGEFFPPMAAVVNGEMQGQKMGEWYKSDEHPELLIPNMGKDGVQKMYDGKADNAGKPNYKFRLNKGESQVEGKKMTTVDAAYNPYFHSSTTMLNDQFAQAVDRPNMVTVEIEVPERELAGEYSAEYAKDHVGMHEWKAGPVQAKLTGTRQVMLSQYCKIVRVVPNEEVAKSIAKQLEGSNVAIPFNVLPPALRAELEKLGVAISDIDTRSGVQKRKFQRMHHNSPAKFRHFDLSHIGEGEGNQVHGYGVYLSKKNLKKYATMHTTYKVMDWPDYIYKSLTQPEIDMLLDELAAIQQWYGGHYASGKVSKTDMKTLALSYFYRVQNGNVQTDEQKQMAGHILDYLKQHGLKELVENKGYHYDVDIPDDNGKNYLDENKPITDEQIAMIRDHAKNVEEVNDNVYLLFLGKTGREIREILSYPSLFGNDEKAISQFLNDCGFVGMRYNGTIDGEGVVIFDEKNTSIWDSYAYLRTPEGRVYGWSQNGEITLAERGVNPNTPVHEYTHLWAAAVRKKNPELWQNIKELFKDNPLVDDVRKDEQYAGLDEDGIMDEVLSRYSGKRGAERLTEAAQKLLDENPGSKKGVAMVTKFVNNIRKALNELWEWVGKNLFGIKEFKSQEEVSDRILYDLFNKTSLENGEVGVGNMSVEKMDSEYIAAAKKGDMKKCEELVRKAAAKAMPNTKVVDKDGLPLIMHHVTEEYFNEFDPSLSAYDGAMFFKSTEGNGGMGSRIINVFLNAEKPIIHDTESYIGSADMSEHNDNDSVINRFGGKMIVTMFDPSHIKSAEPITYDDNGEIIPLSKRFDLEKKDIRYSASNEAAATFYSNAAAALGRIKQEKATPEQWLAMLTKEGGIKAGEDKWMGLSDWLRQSEAKTLTKGEVMQYVRDNAIQIEEVKYHEGRGINNFTTNAIINDMMVDEFSSEHLPDYGFPEGSKSYRIYTEDAGSAYEPLDWMAIETPDGKWYVGDGENNVEVESKENAFSGLALALGIPTNEKELVEFDGIPINRVRLQYTTQGLDNKREIALTVPSIEQWNQSDNIHFGDAGNGRAVAWVRFGETTDEDGKRVLVIDEIQSNRHQQGREKGYKSDFDEDKLKKLREQSDNLSTALYNKYIKGVHPGEDFLDYANEAERAEFDRLHDQINAQMHLQYRGIPDAPFDKNWAELAFKRMLRLAAEEGYDRVAWTTGEQQADRYSIGGVVGSIAVSHNSDGKHIAILMKNGDVLGYTLDENGTILYDEQKGMNISEVIGKELAVKVMQSNDGDVISGDNLRIGGEGMKAFYDQMLPSFVKKYVKKWGATVEDVTLSNVEESGRVMHSVTITPEMRESVMQGQPMFQKTGAPEFVSEEETDIDDDRLLKELRRLDEVFGNVKDEWNTSRDVVLNAHVLKSKTLRKARKDSEKDVRESMAADNIANGSVARISTRLLEMMQAQKEYDSISIHEVVRLANMMIKGGWMDSANRRDIVNVLNTIAHTTVGGYKATQDDIDKLVNKLAELEVTHAKKTFEEFLDYESKRHTKLNISEVAVQGRLAIRGQEMLITYRDMIGSRKTVDELETLMDNALLEAARAASKNSEDEWLGKADGYLFAMQAKAGILELHESEREIRDDMDRVRKEPGFTPQQRKDAIHALQTTLFDNRAEQMREYAKLQDFMRGNIEYGRNAAREWAKKALEQKQKVRNLGDEDLANIPDNIDVPQTKRSLANQARAGLLSPTNTMDTMLRYLGAYTNSAGEGALWEHFVRGYDNAAVQMYEHLKADTKVLDDKASEFLGRKATWADLAKELNKLPGATVRYFNKVSDNEHEPAKMVEHKLEQGNLAYIYAVAKMHDGRMKLNAMGISDEDIQKVVDAIDPLSKKVVDWLQDEFLVDLRKRYNEVHMRLFGAPMDEIKNYFKLYINKRAINAPEDLGGDQIGSVNISGTSTGSIKVRTVNSKPLDLINADAFKFPIEHIMEMDQWESFAELVRDANVLFSDTTFKNRIKNMNTIYGNGEREFLPRLREAFKVALAAYNPERIQKVSTAWMVDVAKGVTAAKVTFRIWTAIKQLTSHPAFFSYMVEEGFAKAYGNNLVHPIDAFRWGLENLPLLRERFEKGDLGDFILAERKSDAEWQKAIMRVATKTGMAPNVLIDTLTCAQGAKAVYEVRLEKYKALGLSEQEAKTRARQDADVCFNKSQQSNKGAFMSPIQAGKDIFTAAACAFRNSNFSYTRNFMTACNNLSEMHKSKDNQIENMRRKYIKLGVASELAKQEAIKDWEQDYKRNIIDIIVYGFGLPAIWSLAGIGPYLVMGGDPDEKKKLIKKELLGAYYIPIGQVHIPIKPFAMPFFGVFGGNVLDGVLSGTMDPSQFFAQDTPIKTDLKKAWNQVHSGRLAEFSVSMFNIVAQSIAGFNPETISQAMLAIYNNHETDGKQELDDVLLDLAALLNIPESQRNMFYIDRLNKEFDRYGSFADLKHSAKYNRLRKIYIDEQIIENTPLVNHIASAEEMEKARKSYGKRFDDMCKERLAVRGKGKK